jgi:hypothetical protein
MRKNHASADFGIDLLRDLLGGGPGGRSALRARALLSLRRPADRRIPIHT